MSLISRFYLHCKFKYISSHRARIKTLKFVYTYLLKNKKTKNKKEVYLYFALQNGQAIGSTPPTIRG